MHSFIHSVSSVFFLFSFLPFLVLSCSSLFFFFILSLWIVSNGPIPPYLVDTGQTVTVALFWIQEGYTTAGATPDYYSRTCPFIRFSPTSHFPGVLLSTSLSSFAHYSTYTQCLVYLYPVLLLVLCMVSAPYVGSVLVLNPFYWIALRMWDWLCYTSSKSFLLLFQFARAFSWLIPRFLFVLLRF